MGTPIFWINLDRRTDRRDFMEAQFAVLALAAERISAISPERVNEKLSAPLREAGASLAPSELCVSASHREAWRLIVERELTHALILEDDAHLSALLPAFLSDLRHLAGTFDIVRVETGPRPVRLGPVMQRLQSGVALHQAFSDQWGTAGYIISQRGAARLLNEPRVFAAPLDRAMFNPESALFRELDWRQCAPGLCIQGDQLAPHDRGAVGVSDVTSERRSRHPKIKLKLGAKIAREAVRLRKQAAALARDGLDRGLRGIRWMNVPYVAKSSRRRAGQRARGSVMVTVAPDSGVLSMDASPPERLAKA